MMRVKKKYICRQRVDYYNQEISASWSVGTTPTLCNSLSFFLSQNGHLFLSKCLQNLCEGLVFVSWHSHCCGLKVLCWRKF